jgi:hypothetical protein
MLISVPEPSRSAACAVPVGRLSAYTLVFVVLMVVLVVLQRLRIDSMAALGMVAVTGWITAEVISRLFGISPRSSHPLA